MIVNAIVQCRMGSTRLPGKVMLEAAGKPLIGHLVDRLLKCRNIDKVVVAIPDKDVGSSLDMYLLNRHAEHDDCTVFLGDETDLCARFLGAIEQYPCDAFVRVCGDSPMIDPGVVDCVAAHLRYEGQIFYSNVGLKTLPRGQSVEGCFVAAYRDLCAKCDQADREHAGFPWVYRQIALADSVVDTPEDFARVKAMIEAGNAV